MSPEATPGPGARNQNLQEKIKGRFFNRSGVEICAFRPYIEALYDMSWRMSGGNWTIVMNRFERFLGLSTEATVKYLDGEFQVVSPGDHVLCVVTGEKIPLDVLSYWSVERQEPYASAEIGFDRLIQLREIDRD